MKITKVLFQVLFVLMLVMLLASCSSISSIKCMDPFNDHTIVVDEAVNPTCTSTGLTEGQRCADCGMVFVAQSIIPELPHTEVVKAGVESTCAKTGLTEGKYCSECDLVIEPQEVVPMKPHREVIKPAVEPTCTKDGITEGKSCADCGKVLVSQTKVPKTHRNVSTISAKDSTCTEVGFTEGKICLDCKEILSGYDIVSMKPHIDSEWIIDKQATEFESGRQHKTCTECGRITVEEVIPQIAYFEYLVNADGTSCTIIGVKIFADIELYIPEYLNGYKVTAIGEEAFADKTQIKAVYISDAVTTIGDRAFYCCTGLTYLNIPEGVETIGVAAFRGCTSIKQIMLPCSLTKIGVFAFDLCDSVKNVYYLGTPLMWNCMTIGEGNDVVIDNVYFYSVYDPTDNEYKTGIFEEDGKLWWYVNGVKTYGGLMIIGGDYYYARSSGEILVNTTYWISKTNDLLPAANYTFGADGKMINPPKTPDHSTAETYYYWHYVDGKPTKW